MEYPHFQFSIGNTSSIRVHFFSAILVYRSVSYMSKNGLEHPSSNVRVSRFPGSLPRPYPLVQQVEVCCISQRIGQGMRISLTNHPPSQQGRDGVGLAVYIYIYAYCMTPKKNWGYPNYCHLNGIPMF